MFNQAIPRHGNMNASGCVTFTPHRWWARLPWAYEPCLTEPSAG
jgi:hypothetical protein